MPNYTQNCPQEHTFHGSFTHGSTRYDVYTYGPEINFCFRHSSDGPDYLGMGSLKDILLFVKYSTSETIRLGLKVAIKSDPEIRNLVTQERHKLWLKACILDGIDPNAQFVIFSDNNKSARLADRLPL